MVCKQNRLLCQRYFQSYTKIRYIGLGIADNDAKLTQLILKALLLMIF